MERDLLRLGLSEKEAKVYLALLELGSSRVQDIAQKSKVHRSTAYVILEELVKKNLASTFEKGKIKFFSPENPENVISVLKSEETEAKSRIAAAHELMPNLLELYSVAEEKPRVRFYEGKEGIKKMLKEFWRHPSKEVFSFLSLDDYYAAFSEKERDELAAIAGTRGIKIQVLLSTHNPEKLRPQEKNTAIRILPANKSAFSSDIEISGNKVISVALKGKLVGILIENEAVAKTMRTIFELAWSATEK